MQRYINNIQAVAQCNEKPCIILDKTNTSRAATDEYPN